MSEARGFGFRLTLGLAAGVIVVAGIKQAQALLVPFLLAIFLAVLCAPPMFWLQKRGLPRLAAAAVMLLVILLVWAGLLTIVGTSVNDFTASLPVYQEKVRQSTAALFDWLAGHGVDLRSKMAIEALDPGASMRLVAKMLTGLGNVLANSFLIFLTVIFILLEAHGFPEKLRTAFGDVRLELDKFRRFADSLIQYLAIKTLVSFVTGTLVGALLFVLDVDFALLWGILAFLLNFIPNIGSIIAAVPAVLLGLVQFGPVLALVVAAWYLVVNIVMGNVVEPRVLGRGLGLSTLVVFLSLVWWGWVFGPVGMLLSVPLTMTVKIALEGTEGGRWLAILLGPEVVQAESGSASADSSSDG